MKQEDVHREAEKKAIDGQSEIYSESYNDVIEQESLSEPDTVEQKEKKGRLPFLAEIVLYIAIVAFCLLFVPRYVVQRTVVDGDSMMDTLQDRDNLIVEKVSYHLGDPNRFDIIVFYPYGRDDKEHYFIKRVIGLPGEKIQIVGEDIYINDEILEESYGKDPITYPGLVAEPIVLGEDEYFVLGDNREISRDSRFEDVGPVKRDLIEGKVLIRLYPFDSFGTVD